MSVLTHIPLCIKQKLFVLILLALGTVIAFFAVRMKSPDPAFGQQVYHAVTPVTHRSAH
jgi:hypothetical protein